MNMLILAAVAAPLLANVPCRDMGYGRTLIDSLFVPPQIDRKRMSFKIIKQTKLPVDLGWANRVCLISIRDLRG